VVEIHTVDGEQLTAKILFVTHDEEHDEHDVLYEVISSNILASYAHLESAGGYVLDFDKILSVRSRCS
jgi:cytochrome oxidase Cu insertion factor (SCO1/SenC/PrrC family)